MITHSSGNHAQAVALAGQLVGCAGHGGDAAECAGGEASGDRGLRSDDRFVRADVSVARGHSGRRVIERHGFTLVHPFDDWNVIAGQGTAALELLEDAGPLDVVICPVGGGGLLAGTALAVEGISPSTKVMAGEPANADDARRSLDAGRIVTCPSPATIADGLRTTSIGVRNFAVIKTRVSQIIAVSEQDIIDAMRFVWERIKIVIEPSSAVAVAPLLTGKLAAGSLRVGVILSGGNVELTSYFDALAATQV